jgi:hypothetical protein
MECPATVVLTGWLSGSEAANATVTVAAGPAGEFVDMTDAEINTGGVISTSTPNAKSGESGVPSPSLSTSK